MPEVLIRRSKALAAGCGGPAPIGALVFVGGDGGRYGIVAGEVLLPKGVPAWLVRVASQEVCAVLPACLIVMPQALLDAGCLPAPGGLA